jgi:hypothetical protein
MPSLRELQVQLATSMGALDSAMPLEAANVDPAVMSPRARIYRNSMRSILHDALCASYPVVRRLVGDKYFESLAWHYQHAHPSTSGNIQDYGGSLAIFIDSQPDLIALPYLGDVARLEWMIQECARAAAPAPADLGALLALPPQRYGDLKFTLCSGARLLCSSYPVLHIWQVNKDPGSEDPAAVVSLAEGGELLLVIRRGTDVEIERLRPGEFAFLCQLEQGHAIECAIDNAVTAEPGVDFARVLSHHLTTQTISFSDARRPRPNHEPHSFKRPGLSA